MDYAEAIKALNDYFEGKDMKRGDALRIAELISRAEKAEKIVDEYAESARAIALWLSGFCNKKLSYPSMISDAARKISTAYADIREILGDNYDLSRLRELVQADREGRCVVLPARIGSKVYRIEYVKDGNTYEIGIGEHVFDYLLFATERKNIGNTIFFTREAAEAALKEREKNEREEM